MEIYDIQYKLEHLKEVAILEKKEWGELEENTEIFDNKIEKKMDKIKANLNRNDYCKLILLDNDTLIGFISMFPSGGDERTDLTPWYATMYIKEQYRGKGYSKILNEAILTTAKKRGFDKIYLKTDLINYYEKFGAKYIADLKNSEKLYYIEL